MEAESWFMYLGQIFIAMFLGYYILTFKIINDYDIKNKFAITLFCLIFSFSINCMALILYEIWKIGIHNSEGVIKILKYLNKKKFHYNPILTIKLPQPKKRKRIFSTCKMADNFVFFSLFELIFNSEYFNLQNN